MHLIKKLKHFIFFGLAFSILFGQNQILAATKRTTRSNKYITIDQIYSNNNESINLLINRKSLNLDLSRTQNIRVRLKPTSLFRSIDRVSSFKIDVLEIYNDERRFISSQNVTFAKGSRKSRIISLDAGSFDEPTKEIELDVFDTTNTLVSTYAAQITATNLSSQVLGSSFSIPDSICDPDAFGECQLDYLFSKMKFEAKPQRQISTRIIKSDDGLYKVTIPVPRSRFNFLGRKVRRKRKNSSSSSSTLANTFGSMLNAGQIKLGQDSNKYGEINYDATNDQVEIGFNPGTNPLYTFDNDGLFGIGINDPMAHLHIQASNGTYPSIVLNPGTLTSPEVDGALEYDGDKLYFTKDGTREELGAQGPAGPQGPIGLQGPQGIQGPTGTFNGDTLNDVTLNGTTTVNGPIVFNTNNGSVEGNMTVNGIVFADQFNGGNFYGNFFGNGAGLTNITNTIINNGSIINGTTINTYINNSTYSNGTIINTYVNNGSYANGNVYSTTINNSTYANGTVVNTFINNGNYANGNIISTIINSSNINSSVFANGSTVNTFINNGSYANGTVTNSTVSNNTITSNIITNNTVNDNTINGTLVFNSNGKLQSAFFNGTTIVNGPINFTGNGMLQDATLNGDTIANGTINGTLLDLDFANGSVIFSDQNGILREDNNNFFWDRQNNRLGVGRNDPNELLTVNGAISMLNLSSAPTTTAGFGKLFSNGNILYYRNGNGAITNLLSSGGGDADTLDTLDSTQFLRSDATDSYTGANTLTISAASTLDIDGTLDIDSTNVSIADTNISLDGASTLFTQTTGPIGLAPAAGFDLDIVISGLGDFSVGNEKLTVDNNGNVGISNLPANERLTLNGSLSLIGQSSAPVATSGYGKLFVNGDILYFRNGNGAITNLLVGNPNADTLDTLDSTQFLRSDASDSYTGANTLTISAASTLDIDGTLDIDSTNVTIADTDIILDGASTTFNGATGAITLLPAAGNNLNVNLSGAGDLAVNTNMLYVDTSASRVGVGDTSPEAELDIGGGTAGSIDGTDDVIIADDLEIDDDLFVDDDITAVGTVTATNLNGTNLNVTNLNTSFTPGSILFANATGDIAQDNSQLYWGDAANRLGIGTNSPDAPLTINGAGAYIFMRGDNGGGMEGLSYLDSSGANRWAFLLPGDDIVTLTNRAVDGVVQIRADDGSGGGGGETIVAQFEDNLVRIGGTTPGNTDIILYRNGSGLFNEQGAAVDFRVEGDTDPNMIFGDGSSDNVGIGHSAPNEKLTVNGNLALASQSSAPAATAGFGKLFVNGDILYFRNGNGAISNLLAGSPNADTLDSLDSTDFLRANATDSYTGANTLTIAAAATLDIDGTLDIDSTAVSIADTDITLDGASTAFTQTTGDISFNPGNGGDLKVTLLGPGDLEVDVDKFVIENNGNVGIGVGTGSIDAKLEVNGSAIFNDAGGDNDFRVEGDTDANLFFVDASVNNVGIGTNTPSEKLDVVGDAKISADIHIGEYIYHDGDADTSIRFQDDDLEFNVGGELAINVVEDGAQDIIEIGDDGDFDIKLSAGKDAAVFVEGSTSNVGIGRDDPAAMLSVNGSAIFNESGGDNDLRVEGDTDVNLFFVDASVDNVGIGTNTPSEKLDVVGDAKVSADIHVGEYIYHDGDADTSIRFQADDIDISVGGETMIDFTEDGTQDIIKLGDGGDIDINFNDDALLQASSGNIGINNLSPNEKLTINGSLSLENLSSAPAATSGFGKLFSNGNILYYRNGNGAITNLLAGGAGGDADTLDTLDSTDLLRSNATDSYTGANTLTIAAAATLDIDGTLDIDSTAVSIADTDITLDGASTTFTQSTGALTLLAANGSNLNFRLDGLSDFVVDTDKLVLDNNGNLGLSYTPTNERLTVNGNVSIKEGSAPSNTAGFGKLYVNSANSKLYFLDDGGTSYNVTNGAASSPAEWGETGGALHPADNSAEQDILIGGTTAGAADIILDNGGNAVFNEQGKAKDFRVEGSGEANALVVQGSDGNIGIGIATPSEELDVVGDAQITANLHLGEYLYHDGDADTSIRFQDDDLEFNVGGELAINVVEDGAQDIIEIGDDGDFDIKLSAGKDAAVFVEGSTSNVGIGRDDPAAMLSVNGSAIFNESGGDNDLRVEGDTDVNLFFVDASVDNVGIGTNTPSEKLDVVGDAKISADIHVGEYIYHDGDADTSIRFQADDIDIAVGGETMIDFTEDGTQDIIKLGDGGDIDINFNDDALLQASSGNIGINNLSPNEKLTINGSLSLENLSSAPAATAGFGKLFSNGNILYYRNGNGAITNLLAGGSGGDATTLDTLDSTQFLRSDTTDSYTGANTLTISSASTLDIDGTLDIDSTNVSIADPNISLDGASTTFTQTTGTITMTPAGGSDFAVSLSGAGDFVVNTNDLVVDTSVGLVGINEVAPDAMLEISTLTSSEEGLHIKASAGQAANLLKITDSSDNDWVTIGVNGAAVFNENSLDADFRIESDNTANAFFVDGANGKVAIGRDDTVEQLTVNGNIALLEGSAPSNTSGFGKLYVNSANSKLYFLDDGGTSYNVTNGAASSPAEWGETSGALHPADNSAEQDILIGGTTAGAADIILDNGGAAVFNEQSKSKDFRIEGDSDINLVFVDGSSDRVGIGVGGASIDTKLEVNGTILANLFNGNFIGNGRELTGLASDNGDTIINQTVNNSTINNTNVYNSTIHNTTVNGTISFTGNGMLQDSTLNGTTTISGGINISGTINGTTLDLDFSNGSVIFSNQEGILQEDNNNFFWDRQNNRLGIGRNDPNELLTVNGSISMLNLSSAPATTSGFGKLFSNGNILYYRNGNGAITNLLAGGGGSDADTLDTLDSTQFLRSDTTDSYTGATTLTISAASTLDIDGTLDIDTSNVTIADSDITLDAASTTFTQTTGDLSLAPASGSDLNINIAGAGDFYVGTDKFTVNDSGNVGVGYVNPGATLAVNGSLALAPSATQSLNAGDAITIANSIIKIAGNGGAVDLTSNPQIADGADGQIIILKGTHNTNTVTLDDGTGLSLTNGISVTLGDKDTLVLMYDAGDDEWIEISRSNK